MAEANIPGGNAKGKNTEKAFRDSSRDYDVTVSNIQRSVQDVIKELSLVTSLNEDLSTVTSLNPQSPLYKKKIEKKEVVGASGL